jgi:hypothetical protein
MQTHNNLQQKLEINQNLVKLALERASYKHYKKKTKNPLEGFIESVIVEYLKFFESAAVR